MLGTGQQSIENIPPKLQNSDSVYTYQLNWRPDNTGRHLLLVFSIASLSRALLSFFFLLLNEFITFIDVQ